LLAWPRVSGVHTAGGGQSIFANSGGIFGNMAARHPRENYGIDEARGLVPVNRGAGSTQNFTAEAAAGSGAAATQAASNEAAERITWSTSTMRPSRRSSAQS
jgi:hypothetical protein